MNEHFITINKKPNRLQKPVILQNEEEEEEKESLSAPYSKHTLSWMCKGVILMQSEDVWEVAGVSFVDKFSSLERSQYTGNTIFHNLGPCLR